MLRTTLSVDSPAHGSTLRVRVETRILPAGPLSPPGINIEWSLPEPLVTYELLCRALSCEKELVSIVASDSPKQRTLYESTLEFLGTSLGGAVRQVESINGTTPTTVAHSHTSSANSKNSWIEQKLLWSWRLAAYLELVHLRVIYSSDNLPFYQDQRLLGLEHLE